MCTPKMPKVQQPKQEIIAAPTMADASVRKARTAQRTKTAVSGNNDIRTSSRGISEEPVTTKKKLLGE